MLRGDKPHQTTQPCTNRLFSELVFGGKLPISAFITNKLTYFVQSVNCIFTLTQQEKTPIIDETFPKNGDYNEIILGCSLL